MAGTAGFTNNKNKIVNMHARAIQAQYLNENVHLELRGLGFFMTYPLSVPVGTCTYTEVSPNSPPHYISNSDTVGFNNSPGSSTAAAYHRLVYFLFSLFHFLPLFLNKYL